MLDKNSARPIEMLLVEDSPGDARLTLEALKEGKIANHLSIAGDGVDALARLRREPPYEATLRPDLVLLDLNLPKKDGKEVLAELKSEPDLQSIPVVVLTASAAESDWLRREPIPATAYMTKPVDCGQLISLVKDIERLRLSIVTAAPA